MLVRIFANADYFELGGTAMGRLLTVAEAARIVGRDPRTIRRWVREEAVRRLGLESGGRVFVRRSVLERLVGETVAVELSPTAT